MNPIYYETKKTGKVGGSVCIYLNHVWGMKIGELVNITVYKLDDPEKRTYYATRRICSSGTGGIVFFDKAWGIERGEMVTMTLQRISEEE